MDKKLKILGRENSLLNRYLEEMRDEEIQKDRMRFRINLERCSQIIAYEISKRFPYVEQEVTTPLGSLQMSVPEEEPVVATILRAGLPMHEGILSMFDHADSGFISAYRKHTHGNEFEVRVEYLAVPRLDDRILILADPMIATGTSLVLSYNALVPAYGTPKKLFIAGIIGSEQGVEYVRRQFPNAEIFMGAVDGELTAKSYIVPGLGDAGDLAYGPKE